MVRVRPVCKGARQCVCVCVFFTDNIIQLKIIVNNNIMLGCEITI